MIRRLLPYLTLLLCLWLGGTLSVRAQETPPVQNPPQVKAKLKQILASPEFQPETHEENVISRFFKWIGDQWDAFWKWVRKALGLDRQRSQQRLPMGATGMGVQWLVIGTFILLGLVLLAFLIRGLVLLVLRRLEDRDSRASKKKTVFDIDNADADMVREPDVWVQQAQRFADTGDYRRAIRALFLAILLQLDQAGAIEYQRYRTNGDYLRLLRSQGYDTLVQVFRPFVLDFEIRWYGDRATQENDYRNCLTEYERLRAMISSAGLSTAPSAVPGRA
ncbi:MAG TPA: DUF4129 domain-containing protein [Chthonomonadaceae bacterium]|nr:DUF4129 domain-containing protein [Chthonomonadaceae bacterium]